MRIVHEAVRTLLKLLFGIDDPKEQTVTFQDMELEKGYRRLKELVHERKLDEAENLLSDYMEKNDPEGFKMALLFYDTINEFDEETLEQAGFTRDEITEGMLAAARLYGYDSMAEALFQKE